MQVLTQYLGGQIDDDVTSSIIVSNFPGTVRSLSKIHTDSFRGFAALCISNNSNKIY